jgi:hypothetical protein
LAGKPRGMCGKWFLSLIELIPNFISISLGDQNVGWAKRSVPTLNAACMRSRVACGELRGRALLCPPYPTGCRDSVVPAKAGTQRRSTVSHWIPAFAGTTCEGIECRINRRVRQVMVPNTPPHLSSAKLRVLCNSAVKSFPPHASHQTTPPSPPANPAMRRSGPWCLAAR